MADGFYEPPRKPGGMRVIRLYPFGEVCCAEPGCREYHEVRLYEVKNGNEKHSIIATPTDIRYFSYEAGWRQNKRGKWFCPEHRPEPEQMKTIEHYYIARGERNGVIIE